MSYVNVIFFLWLIVALLEFFSLMNTGTSTVWGSSGTFIVPEKLVHLKQKHDDSIVYLHYVNWFCYTSPIIAIMFNSVTLCIV